MKNNRNIFIFLILSVAILVTLVALVLLLVYDARNNGSDELGTRETQQAILDDSRTEMAQTQASDETTTVTATQTMTATLKSDFSDSTATPTDTATPASNTDLTPTSTQAPVATHSTIYTLRVTNQADLLLLTFEINGKKEIIAPGKTVSFDLPKGTYSYTSTFGVPTCQWQDKVKMDRDRSLSFNC